jgi:hypothetical protein
MPLILPPYRSLLRLEHALALTALVAALANSSAPVEMTPKKLSSATT